MIWESTVFMTVIDVAICGFAIVAIGVATRARQDLRAVGTSRAVWIVIFGLAVIGGFYLIDLWVMHVLPRYTSQAEAVATMERLHLDWNWVVSLVAVASIFLGLLTIVQSETGLLARVRIARTELSEGVEKRASIEGALAAAQARLAGALRAARMVTFDYDVIEDTIEWSERTSELFGVGPPEIDSSVQGYLDLIHPGDVEMMRRAVALALKRGGSYSVEHRTILPSGETRWLAGRGWVYLDDEGKATKMTGVGWDITDQRRVLEAKEDAERRNAEADRRLSRQQRLESLGTLSGGIAHDFNNLLTPIVGHVEMLKDEIRDPDQLKSLLQIQIAAERARGLVRQILAFSGNVEPAGGTVNVAECVGQALDLVRATLPATIDIQRFLDKSSGAVAADPTQLTQVVVNLCTNSAHAMPEGGSIEVRVAHVDIDAAAVGEASGPSVGAYVRITVSDDGVGMDRAVSNRAFEPFFTTREPGQGSGLGLSQVLGIVTAYGGAVTLDSERDFGTSVEVFLPTVELDSTASSTPHDPDSRGSARVLVVDDEPAVAGIACSMLESLGYTVAVEASPTAALERFRNAPDEFDLLVTDHTMPGMTGITLAQRVRAERPGLPTVLMSGHADPVGPMRDVVFLIKPFTRALLSAAVQGALESKGRQA